MRNMAGMGKMMKEKELFQLNMFAYQQGNV
jgi:hypothetical protein